LQIKVLQINALHIEALHIGRLSSKRCLRVPAPCSVMRARGCKPQALAATCNKRGKWFYSKVVVEVCSTRLPPAPRAAAACGGGRGRGATSAAEAGGCISSAPVQQKLLPLLLECVWWPVAAADGSGTTPTATIDHPYAAPSPAPAHRGHVTNSQRARAAAAHRKHYL